MSDRGTSSYTPNRKPRRGRGGGGNTPRASSRGRGASSAGDPSPSSVSSPTVSSTASPPVTTPRDPPPPPPSPAKTPVSQGPEKTESPASELPKKVSQMDTPQRSEIPQATSPSETFSTPSSSVGARGVDEESFTPKTITEITPRGTPGLDSSDQSSSTISSLATETNKPKTNTPVPAEPSNPAEAPVAPVEAVKPPPNGGHVSKSSGASGGAPEKPPRKTSVERDPTKQQSKQPEGKKVYEAPAAPMSSTPRPGGLEPPLTIEITMTPKDPSKGSPLVSVGQSPGTSGTGKAGASQTIVTPARRKSQVSPGGFAYGLGGPLGKPAYGISPIGGDDSHPPKRVRSTSVMELKEAVKGFTARQWITLIVFGLADFFSAMVISLQAPFYPPEAERKGATATEYGLVFGVFELTSFIMSPIYGKYMNKLGPRLMFNVGITTSSVACVCFGFLDQVEDHTMFITLSFIIRIVEAIGTSAFVTSTFTIIACEFPEAVATTFASLETFFGLGLIVGPTVGGALFQLGGFTLPFAVTGACLLALAIMSVFVMPKIEQISDADGNVSEGIGIFDILRIPSVFIAGLSVFSAASTIGFLSATLEPHLRQFQLQPIETGLMFIISGGTYAFCAPGIGWICDQYARPIYISLFGAVAMAISFLIIGPAPFIPLQTVLWLVGVGLFIHGIGLAALFVSGFIAALKDSMEHGFPDNLMTYGVVSGLWTSTLSLGAFIGPSIGGVLLDNYGFIPASYYPLATEILIALFIIVFLLMQSKLKQKAGKQESGEVEPLLKPSSPSPSRKETKEPSTYGATGDSPA